MVQCDNAKGAWELTSGGRIAGYVIVYEYDIMVMAATKWVFAAMEAFTGLCM